MNILAVTWDASPEMFTLGTLTMRYYGFFFVLGFILGYFMLRKFYRFEGVAEDEVDKLTLFSFIVAIVGARLGHILFYEPDYYFQHPEKILKIWQGGVASHGATVALIIGIWFYVRRKLPNYVWTLDRMAIPTALAAGFVRIGNLMNSEIFGHETGLSWGFRFIRSGKYLEYVEQKFQKPLAEIPVETMPGMHPTQIYEAMAYIFIFLFLLVLYYRKKAETPIGLLSGWFLTLLFGARFFLEFFKLEQVDFEKGMLLNMGQLLSLPLFLFGIFMIVYAGKGKIPRPVFQLKKVKKK